MGIKNNKKIDKRKNEKLSTKIDKKAFKNKTNKTNDKKNNKQHIEKKLDAEIIVDNLINELFVDNKKISKHKQRKKSNNFMIILLIIFLLVFVYSLYQIVHWLQENDANARIIDELSKTVVKIEEKNEEDGESKNTRIVVDFNALRERNESVVGYLMVKGTDVEYPVVQSNDNKYYLTHNLDYEYNKGGWVYADYRNRFDDTDRNIIFYGHNRKDGTMFATLLNILKEEWYTNPENYLIEFITPAEYLQYEVFSVYKIVAEDYYIKTNFDDISFRAFLLELQRRSIYDFGVEVGNTDQIITLSTCDNNLTHRVVLHAKLINREPNATNI